METSAKIRFENDNDFIDGTISLGKMLDKWKSTCDEGGIRDYEMTPKSAELSVDIILRVTK